MLNLLRVIKFPDDVSTHAPHIPAQFLRHAADYDRLIEIAKRDAQAIIDEAESVAHRLRETARAEAIESVKGDVFNLSDLSAHHFNHLLETSTQLVVDVVTASVERLIGELSDAQKLRKLVSMLVVDGLNSRQLKIECNPEQIESIQKEMLDGLSKSLAIHEYELAPAADLSPYEMRLISPGGAERKVSLKNMIGLFGAEIKKMENEIQQYFIEANTNEQY